MTGSTVLAGLLIAVMAALSLLHGYWGLGGVWPGTDAASLARTVVGVRSGRMPGLVPSLFVAACLFAVAAFIAWRAGWFPSLGLPHWLWSAGYFGATLVFAARGLAGFLPAVFRYAEGTPFARLNLIIYSPLCLAIAAGMIVLWLTRRPEG
jgi:hypothetical protein